MGFSTRVADLFPSLLQVQEHDHAGFGVQSRQGDQSHPHRDRDLEIRQIQEPERSHQRERHREHHDRDPREGLGVQIEDQDNQEQGERDHGHHAFFDTLHAFPLSAPGQSIPGREGHRMANAGARLRTRPPRSDSRVSRNTKTLGLPASLRTTIGPMVQREVGDLRQVAPARRPIHPQVLDLLRAVPILARVEE
jgi:hypothetical protein